MISRELYEVLPGAKRAVTQEDIQNLKCFLAENNWEFELLKMPESKKGNKEIRVIILRLRDDYTFTQAGAAIGVGSSRAQQIYKEGINRIMHPARRMIWDEKFKGRKF